MSRPVVPTRLRTVSSLPVHEWLRLAQCKHRWATYADQLVQWERLTPRFVRALVRVWLIYRADGSRAI